MELVLVRHGKTAWNSDGRFQGRSDIPLSEVGRAQARAIAEALAYVTFTRAYASDLSRAVETATIIAKPHGLSVETDERLREFDFGDWEGLTWREIVARWPELADNPYTSARLYHPHGGESFGQVVERVRGFIEELDERSDDRVLVVAHAGALHAIMDALGVISPEPLAFSTASISRVAMDGRRARLMLLNDVSHLDPTS